MDADDRRQASPGASGGASSVGGEPFAGDGRTDPGDPPAAGPPGQSDGGLAPDEPEISAAPPLPPLPVRLLQVLFSPGKLTAALAANPAWVGALLVSAVLVALQMGLIPPEVFSEAQRQAALEAGREVAEIPEAAQQAMRVVVPLFAGLTTLILPFVFAGLYAFVFSFVLGDEGGYRQYLAMVTHAWFIPALAGLILTPLRISTGDPQLSLNLASFMFFLPEGYLFQTLRFMDLTQVWSSLVVAQGVHTIDARRGFGAAAAILIGIQLAFALLLAAVIPA